MEQEEFTEVTDVEVIEDVETVEDEEIEETTIVETSEIAETSETIETTGLTVTTIDYMSEIALNTARTANCVSYLSGLSVILIAIFISTAILKVFFGGKSF